MLKFLLEYMQIYNRCIWMFEHSSETGDKGVDDNKNHLPRWEAG